MLVVEDDSLVVSHMNDSKVYCFLLDSLHSIFILYMYFY